MALLHFLFLCSSLAWSYKVVIDPGHGGADHGASRESIRESDIVLKLAHLVKESFIQTPQIEVELTRPENQFLTLQERIQKTEKSQADLFLSLHANTDPTEQARGLEIFFQNSLPPDEESLFLAHLENQQTSEPSNPLSHSLSKQGDVKAIVEDLQRQSKIALSLEWSESLEKKLHGEHVQIKQAPFYVLIKNRVPSILVEIGFMSHSQELKKMTSHEYQKKLAHLIHETILEQAQRKGLGKNSPLN